MVKYAYTVIQKSWCYGDAIYKYKFDIVVCMVRNITGNPHSNMCNRTHMQQY